MKTLKEVKKHFKNAKEVKCLTDGEISDITKKRINDIHFDDGCFWVTMAKNKNGSINLYRSKTDKFAEIISYKSTKEKTPKKELKALLNLAKECLEKPNSEACQTYKDKILDACPSLKKEDEVLEVGQWYELKTGLNDYFICLKKIRLDDIFKGSIAHSHYGFKYGKYHVDSWANTDMSKSLKKADPKQVEELLIAEAKKRGFKKGVSFVNLFNGDVFTSQNNSFEYLDSGELTLDNNTIFNTSGNWSEIIETISLSEAENKLKELGIIVKIV